MAAEPAPLPEPNPELCDGHDPELSPTARVILGMLTLGKRTGYDIKQLVDKSTRLFWAASYGQIYPELRRLEAQGLVRGEAVPTGGRARIEFELTAAGERALRDWLESDLEPFYELRDEGMLKLFFSDAAGPECAIATVRAMRARHERKLAQLQSIQEMADGGPPGPRLTLALGIGLTEGIINRCSRTELRLIADQERE
jgi:DNA-binding PadR family transcriptional regulator